MRLLKCRDSDVSDSGKDSGMCSGEGSCMGPGAGIGLPVMNETVNLNNFQSNTRSDTPQIHFS